jgi:hypothetical protein
MRTSVFGILLTFGVSITALHAQTEVLSSGGDAFGNGGSYSYSVGQIVYLFTNDATGSSSAGIQQPFEFFSVDVDENSDVCLSMSVYPNPAQSRVELNVEKISVENLSYQLFDMSGQLIHKHTIVAQQSPIDMETLPSGMYLLQVLKTNTTVQSFTIIKKN